MIFEHTTRIDAPLGRVFAFFSQHENLLRLTPPSMQMRILRADGPRLREGLRVDYTFRAFGFVPMRWTARITRYVENEVFADLQESGPFRYWLHTHSFRAAGAGVEMHDHVEYELPLGLLGRLFGSHLVARHLREMFAYREQQIRALL